MKETILCGVAINDANYSVSKWVDGKNVWYCPYYLKWSNMIKRCYSKTQKTYSPSYEKSYVCEEWLRFSNFKRWVDSQPNKDWINCEPDKDILSLGESCYSPKTVVFVSTVVNNFINDSKPSKSVRLTGATPVGNKFLSQCSHPIERYPSGKSKNIYLGLFDTEQEAHSAWKAKKHELACQLADMQKDLRVAKALRERYK